MVNSFSPIPLFLNTSVLQVSDSPYLRVVSLTLPNAKLTMSQRGGGGGGGARHFGKLQTLPYPFEV